MLPGIRPVLICIKRHNVYMQNYVDAYQEGISTDKDTLS